MIFAGSRVVYSIAALALLIRCAGSGTGAKQVPPPRPTIQKFAAENEIVVRGATGTLNAAFQNGTGSIDHGVGLVTSGSPVVVSPVEDTTYTLSVTNDWGTVTSTTLVKVVPDSPITIAPISIPPSVAPGQFGTASILPVDGASYSWQVFNATFSSPHNGPSIQFVAGERGAVMLYCTVTRGHYTASAVASCPILPL